MKTTVSSKGQIVLPADIRRRDRIQEGDEFDVERIDEGAYRLTRRRPRANSGVFEWLSTCPEPGYFVAIESESTDEL